MDLSDTLINSKLLITNPGLRSAVLVLHQARGHASESHQEHCLRLTMQCQHDRSHIFGGQVINNYLDEVVRFGGSGEQFFRDFSGFSSFSVAAFFLTLFSDE